jgi:hypothetical protein
MNKLDEFVIGNLQANLHSSNVEASMTQLVSEAVLKTDLTIHTQLKKTNPNWSRTPSAPSVPAFLLTL